jgi:hypothetical protein
MKGPVLGPALCVWVNEYGDICTRNSTESWRIPGLRVRRANAFSSFETVTFTAPFHFAKLLERLSFVICVSKMVALKRDLCLLPFAL